uniref:FP protein C-terminal domain-containing protein n=1 Tax=Heliothis virescens TaxID=7102 RepID=A0A2A4JD60_HELVI
MSESIDDSSEGEDEKVNDIRRIIREEIRNTLRIEVKNIIGELRLEMDELKKQIDELKLSGCFDISQVNDLKSELMVMQRENTELRSQNSDMQKAVAQLTTQFNTLDQNMREANLEIHGLPENKNEVLPTIITQLANVVSYTLNDCDIMKCVRVASTSNDKLRPRSVVVKLRSPRCRDELYSAITRYNKSHSDNKLNTNLLGYGGNKEPVYVSEHLSPAYKSLHAAARLKAKEKSYKFVWVRYGKIFVCKGENSKTILIKDKQCLDKII